MADERLEIPNFELETGQVLDLVLSYRIFGSMNAEGSNVVLFPTYFGGVTASNEYLIGGSSSGCGRSKGHGCG